MESQFETTDVIICGCGPTGAILSAFLGRANVSNIVVEKDEDITADPRGITLDDDAIRTVQALGLYSKVFSEMGTYFPRARFLSGVNTSLHRREILSIDTASTAGNTGHIGLLSHKQPTLEKNLRSAMLKTNNSTLRASCTLIDISEDCDWVYATYLDSDGAQKQLRGRFLIGADGKTGFTRKKYLEPKGIAMQSAEGVNYKETWVALNWRIKPPLPETHPRFPLWKLGYSSSQVYDEFFPRDFTFLCNPKRPAVCGRFGLECDRLWRFEFVVAQNEDPHNMASPEMIQSIVFPYLTHPGSRYGLEEDVEFPQDCIEVLRCRPFQFDARSCNKWALNRVILCGDAAHVFPPFGGQGIASGFRDAEALSWRLALICHSNTNDYEATLACWYLERQQQLERSLATTLRNGNLVNSRDPLAIFLRDWSLWLVQLIPSFKRWLQLGPRARAPIRYEYSPGMAFMPELGGGSLFAQAFCVELIDQNRHGSVKFTDDVIFAAKKSKLFQIVILIDDLAQVDGVERDLEAVDAVSTCAHVSFAEATILVRRDALDATSDETTRSYRIFRTATAREFSESELCHGRPFPHGYEEAVMWTDKRVKRKRYILLRHDRFVFASCENKAELQRAVERLQELFP